MPGKNSSNQLIQISKIEIMEKDLLSRIAIVTGAASGIGEAAALLYAAHGAKVVVSDINEKSGNEVVEKIRNNSGESIFVKTDVSDAKQCNFLVNKTVETFGSVDVCFNNAGISGESNSIADMSIEGWNKMIETNLNSVFYCMKYQIAQMLKQGKGAIINNSSILGSVGFANAAAYTAAKHGIIGLTQTAAIEYSKNGIRTNAIGPGFINTPLLSKAGINEEARPGLVSLHPIGRFGESNEVAELVIWLSSDKSSFVSGSYYAVDGGYLAN
jgi:NAD(P)-dependent dehydrogenase (short-subunit alcohol dehydrogenase family)